MVTRRCPCGYETRAAFRAGNPDPPPAEPAITAEFYSTASESETAKWRSQLERKFETPREKFTDIEEAQRRVDDMFRPPIPGLKATEKTEAEMERREAEVEPADAIAPEVITSSPVDQASELGSAELDLPPGSRRVALKSSHPAQQELSLEPLIAEVAKSKAPTVKGPRAAVSKEIIVTRVLAGILDLFLPVATAVIFVFTASWFLDLDFFSPLATRSWLVLAAGFYFLNSLYFFWSTGRTPGMCITGLRLVGQDSEEVSFASVAVRILLYLPVLVTVIGLVLAVFDADCRALHDRLSKTRVVHAWEPVPDRY
ncbi:MAG: RDD family protein [Acidobacteria bacterium]|nr:MAG: RDD family protein [Acidobacteriota bacterium]